LAKRWNCRRHGGPRRLRLIEFNAVSTIVLGAVERGVGFDRLFAETIVKCDKSCLKDGA
jgi:hypothetical protein